MVYFQNSPLQGAKTKTILLVFSLWIGTVQPRGAICLWHDACSRLNTDCQTECFELIFSEGDKQANPHTNPSMFHLVAAQI